MSAVTPVRRALISVSDKTGIVEFAQGLAARGVVLLSTGGTYRLLRDNNIAVTEVSEHTQFPEMMDGRVDHDRDTVGLHLVGDDAHDGVKQVFLVERRHQDLADFVQA